MIGPARLACLALWSLAMIAGVAEAKPRVASINMCTDQLVLALADDEQIVGLSALSRDHALSYYRQRAMRFPTLSGTAEDVLALKPDIVVTATFARAQTRAMLAASGLPVAAFDNARTVAEVRDQITRMGEVLDQRERAASAVAAIDIALNSARKAKPAQSLTILPLERRGWITGRDTLLTDVLKASGQRNLGAELVEYGARLPLEIIVSLEPDRLLVTAGNQRAEDQGAAMLQHPALARLKARGVIALSEPLLVCAGPMLAEAFDQLSRQLSPAR